MEELSLAALARMIAADVLRARPAIGETGTDAIAHLLETALRTAVRQERLACVAECERRRDLWRGSLLAEARFRANEASVLADALRARSSA
ncbi:MAG TPA: hypothetical protein VLT82_06705 [Myxococcaceae bacterium]|nr:hypothetical protein [Myxococcaceae bacterium]